MESLATYTYARNFDRIQPQCVETPGAIANAGGVTVDSRELDVEINERQEGANAC